MRPALLVERVGPGVTIQDRGRPGWMHHAVPPGGALDPTLHAMTVASLGHGPEVAAVEIPWFAARLRARGDLVVSVDGDVRALRDGEVLDVDRIDRAVRYVALRGGVDVPARLGGRGTLLVAALGGFHGRALRRGDAVEVGDAPITEALSSAAYVPDLGAAIEVMLGPDTFSDEAIALLLRGTFEVSTAVDRVGMRLRGPSVPPPGAAVGRSSPMVRGAIEVTPDGGLIALGPDHPVTGGYPVIAVVRARCLGALSQRRPGAAVRFALTPS